MQMVRGNGGNQFRQYVRQNVRNQNGYNAVQTVKNQVVQNADQNPSIQNVGNQNGLIVVLRIANQNLNPNGNGNVVEARAEGNAIRNNEAWIQLQAEEFDFMAAVGDLEEIKEVNANCILMANLQQASTSGTQTDKAPVYDSDGSVEVHEYDNCYNNEILNMFTQKEQYTELLVPIPEPHQEQANKITWIELKRLLTNKYFPRIEVKKMEDEFYNLVVKGNDLKTYIRRFQDSPSLYAQTSVPKLPRKLWEVFINGLLEVVEGKCYCLEASKLWRSHQHLPRGLMDQIIKHDYVQEANDRK
ncbi:hypothetical protein Tco_0615267 [Tanacetum coccineum]